MTDLLTGLILGLGGVYASFKKYFIDYIQQLYLVKDFSFENLNEDEIFIKKKKILLLVELIGTIYIEKYINFDIVNIG
jgi:hypothetical protein